MKKILSMMLTLVLIVTMLPTSFVSVAQAATASGNYFIFPNEVYDNTKQARVTTSSSVTLTGTLNGINASGISYTVSKISQETGDDGTVTDYVLDSREEQTGGINVIDSSITIQNITLYTGLNRITFKGLSGSSSVYDSIYIEYRNGPTLEDLKITLNGNQKDLEESKATVIYSDSSRGDESTNVIISGVANNAEKVQVTVVDPVSGDKSWTFNVSQSTNWSFIASSISLDHGTNQIKIRAYNSSQSVETTRMVTFFNGNVTFYNVNLHNGNPDDNVDITMNTNVSDVADNQYTQIIGQLVIPYSSLPTDSDGNITGTRGIDVTLSQTSGASASVTSTAVITNEEISGSVVLIDFEYDHPDALLDSYNVIEFTVTGINSQTLPNQSTTVKYTLTVIAAGQPYFYEANVLSGYQANMDLGTVLGLSSELFVDAKFSGLPSAVEFVVVNGEDGDQIDITKITNSSGTSQDLAQSEMNFLGSELTIVNIGGVQHDAYRYVYEISKLPISGTQTIQFTYTGDLAVYEATVSLVYGPYFKFDKAYNGQSIQVNTAIVGGWQQGVFEDELGELKGELFNAVGDGGTDTSKMAMYLNNNRYDVDTDGDGKIFPDGTDVYEKLVVGENNIRFVYITDTTSYQNDITVTILSTNLPSVGDIFPYSDYQTTSPYPVPDYSLFEYTGGIYYTSEAEFNVFGEFDFIDLDTDDPLSGIDTTSYEVQITSPTLDKEYVWTLNNKFTIIGGNLADDIINESNLIEGLEVVYDRDEQSFAFFIKGLETPDNGSMAVVTVIVTSHGTSAMNEMTLIPINVPYTVVRPLDQKRLVNQNFVEVVINAPDADKVIINKQELEKEQYVQLMPDPADDKTFEDAYRTIIMGLKENKDTTIEFTIVQGDTSIEDSFTVRYVPTNIPGAKFMATMSSSHKVFDGALTLSFEKGTSLIRKDATVAEQFKNQVYSGHSLLFGIANSEDGVIDRHEFEPIPANYDLDLTEGKYVFTGSFPDQFVKVSSVFWIDPGLADNLNESDTAGTTDVYDPVLTGGDPYPFSNEPNTSFYKRDLERELVPSERGSLTLSYDSDMTTDAGRLVTVFRFDPELQQWENIGGVVDEKKRTITVPFDRFGYYVAAKLAYSYDDVVNHSYARDYIETIYAKGVMNPEQPLTAFGTSTYVSRGEFTRMIVKALQIALDYSGEKHFSDMYVPEEDSMNNINVNGLWDFRYAETAARKGIVRGVSPNVFDGDSPVKRQDAAVMIAKALDLKLDTDSDKIDSDLRKYFQDADSIDYYAKASVLAIAKKGFIEGVPVNPSDSDTAYLFNPDAYTLRGDAALIMARVMISEKKLPKM